MTDRVCGWVQASDGASDDRFGKSVAMHSGLAIIGAYRAGPDGTDVGAAYVFEEDEDGGWREVQKLLPRDGSTDAQFGTAVALSAGARSPVQTSASSHLLLRKFDLRLNGCGWGCMQGRCWLGRTATTRWITTPARPTPSLSPPAPPLPALASPPAPALTMGRRVRVML